MDYCSQLWSPNDQFSINQLEDVQRHFISRISGLDFSNYWERLSCLHLYSQESRRERYQVIFLWKISQGLVHGYNMEFHLDERRGRLVIPHRVNWNASAPIRRAKEASLPVKGSNIFNSLPKYIRNLNANVSNCDKVLEFKTKLDLYLSKVPDQPTISGLSRAAETNSLLHQIPLFNINDRY